MMSQYLALRVAVLVAGAAPLAAISQQSVKLPDEVTRAATLGVPLDPEARVDAAQMPGDLGRRALESLGLTSEQLLGERAMTYSATHLQDDAGELSVYFGSVVRQRDRWVFWSEDLPQQTARSTSEVQLELATARDVRYLVDVVLDSAEQDFAIVVAETRTTQAPAGGHLAFVVDGTGRREKIRLLPLGDAQHSARWYTLFHVTVTPIH